MAYITADDLTPFAEIAPAKADEMIADAVAQAVLAAPCLLDEDEVPDHLAAAVKSVLRRVVLRWNDSGSGALQSERVGDVQFTHDTRQQPRALLWPSEIEQLQQVCTIVSGGSTGKAFSVDAAPSGCRPRHALTCSVVLGANFCDCGAALTCGPPLFVE
jgi:hypothetical protein